MGLRIRHIIYCILVLQDRLNKQQEDNDQERQRLQELVARLETQIREQTRMLEEVSFVETQIREQTPYIYLTVLSVLLPHIDFGHILLKC